MLVYRSVFLKIVIYNQQSQGAILILMFFRLLIFRCSCFYFWWIAPSRSNKRNPHSTETNQTKETEWRDTQAQLMAIPVNCKAIYS